MANHAPGTHITKSEMTAMTAFESSIVRNNPMICTCRAQTDKSGGMGRCETQVSWYFGVSEGLDETAFGNSTAIYMVFFRSIQLMQSSSLA